MESSETVVVVPKGTLVKIGGFPAELVEDAPVICGTIVGAGGFAAFSERYLLRYGDVTTTAGVDPAGLVGEKVSP